MGIQIIQAELWHLIMVHASEPFTKWLQSFINKFQRELIARRTAHSGVQGSPVEVVRCLQDISGPPLENKCRAKVPVKSLARETG